MNALKKIFKGIYLSKAVSLPSIAMAFFMSSCSSYVIEPTSETETTRTVDLRLSVDSWRGETSRAEANASRAEEKQLSPVILLLVPEGESNVLTKKVVEDDDYTLEIPNGDYEIFAVCGLPSDVIPDDLFEEIEIPQAIEDNGLTDFAVGSVIVTNEYGKLSSSSVSIAAKRQMAWLTATINDIPTEFSTIALHLKGQAETYNLANKWNITEEGKNAFTNCNILRRRGKNYAQVDNVCIPCSASSSSTEFRIVATTSDGKTLTYKFISDLPLVAGYHLTANLSVNDMVLVNETVTVGDWNEGTVNGTLTNPTVE